MHIFFGMVAATFDFFVDLGNEVDFMGLSLWQISFLFFVFSCLFRWVFPLIFGSDGVSGGLSGVFSGVADSVEDGAGGDRNWPVDEHPYTRPTSTYGSLRSGK